MEGTEYPHIENIYSRDLVTNKLTNEYKTPEFKALENIDWIATEKVDGTNIRLIWTGTEWQFNGKTNNAQIHGDLVKRILEVIKDKTAMAIEKFGDKKVVIYCEGYGAGIQKGGVYNKTKDLIVFDVKIGETYLDRGNVEGIAELLGLKVVPIVKIGKLTELIEMVRSGLRSQWSGEEAFMAEGIVVRPIIELKGKHGRIIAKIKGRDFPSQK